MAFPQVAATNTSLEDAGNVTSHTVSLPSGIVSGNLLIVGFNTDGQESVTWPTGWTEIFEGIAASSQCTLAIAYRQADGGEGSTIIVTTGTSERSAHWSYRITDHEAPATQAPQASGGATGTSASPDPDSLTPTGGAKDYLWIAVEGHDRDKTTDAFPTNYDSNQVNTAGAGAGSAGVAAATDEVNAVSEDPGAFTISATEEWVTATVAVHPAAAGGAPPTISLVMAPYTPT